MLDLDSGTGGGIFRHWRVSLLLVVVTVTPAATVLASVPQARSVERAAMMVAQAAGVMLIVGAVLFYLYWRARPTVEVGWMVATGAVVAVQVLSGGSFGLASGIEAPQLPWSTGLDALAASVALGLVACRKVERVCDPLLLGLGVGFAIVGLEALPRVAPMLGEMPVALADVALVVILASYLGLARTLHSERCLPAWASTRLAAAVCLVGIGETSHTVRGSEEWAAVVAAVAFALASGLWTSTHFFLAHGTTEAHDRRSAELEESLLHLESAARSAREQLHEVKSTIAGIASASRLLDRSMALETRRRLDRTIRAELDRLERLLTGDALAEAGPVDLDETLDVLLESHRARGRAIEWQPCGARVHGDRDDVAEVLNILLDNAAKHGGAVPSRVDVSRSSDEVRIAVCDEGPGVPEELRERIFDWGARAGTAPGEGIGLHLARRLVTRHGGSLTLADQDAPGSAFVVRLPAARTSEDQHGRHS